MKLILSIVVIMSCYYSFTYGIYLWKNEKNKLPALGVMLITILGVIVPIINIYKRV